MSLSQAKILSGIQPSGKLHIGNYLGALKNFVALQNSGDHDCYFCIVDYHSITEDYDPKDKPGQILDLAMDFLAAGLDPKKSTIFLQSLVPEHLELTWIFDTVTPIAELTRMTQFKDKAAKQARNINAGLFTYPVLQAADILIYKPAAVPVGHDQLQHLELTNDIARRFNRKFSPTFAEIKPLLTATPRVMSLKDPDKKMSKSDPASCIFLTDEPDEILEKLKRAVTDTAPGAAKSAGVANLFSLLEYFGDKAELDRFNRDYQAGTIRYSELKEALAHAISDYFSDFRTKRKKLAEKPEAVKKIILNGSKQARKVAQDTLAEVKNKIGIVI